MVTVDTAHLSHNNVRAWQKCVVAAKVYQALSPYFKATVLENMINEDCSGYMDLVTTILATVWWGDKYSPNKEKHQTRIIL